MENASKTYSAVSQDEEPPPGEPEDTRPGPDKEAPDRRGEDGETADEIDQFIADPVAGDEAVPPGNGARGAKPGDGTPRRKNLEAVWTWMRSYAFYVYASQALSAWGDRMWSFAVGLYLVVIEENSLRLTAVYGLSLTTSVFLFGAVVGRWVDRTPRLRAVRVSLFLQNSFVLLNALTMCAILIWKDPLLDKWGGYVYTLVQLLIILLGVCAKLSSQAQKIAVQKDWIVVIAGDNREYLADLNASIRRIDLTVNILSPIVVGQIMTFGSMIICGIFIAAWNLVSMFVEYALLHVIYTKVPALAIKKKVKEPTSQNPEQSDTTASYPDHHYLAKPIMAVINFPRTFWEGLKIYHSYPIFWAALGLATVYMTVMGFDSITTGYGYALGLPEYMIGIFQALGSLAGIMGTVMFLYLRRKVGIVRSGLYSIFLQISMLMLGVGSIFAPGSPFDPRFIHTRANTPNVTGCLVTEREVESYWSAGLFFSGLILSRIGLWSFDLVTSQQIQETVAENQRGVFNGVQSSLQSSFDMVHFMLVIVLPCPESFGYLIMASFVFMCLGAFMYCIFSYKTRGHILPNQIKACIFPEQRHHLWDRRVP